MNRLSSHLGLSGPVRVLFELLLLWISLIMFGLAGYRLRGASEVHKGEDNPP